MSWPRRPLQRRFWIPGKAAEDVWLAGDNYTHWNEAFRNQEGPESSGSSIQLAAFHDEGPGEQPCR